ncbi:hypothetical protein Patl1_14846 [Pistacia atlantica]|uniref:Uncharacterized protein n=1 Tax=Pistacia atlantica TaxID=434234 RepID=A0ACC1ARZ5_9ROSI|nr:hypothetical protein Patl1_14846 [Pistacia atlantica]
MWTSGFLAYLCNYSSTVFVSELDNNDAQLGRAYEDLLVEIVRRIRLQEDFVSFRYVCRSWKSVAVEENFRYKSIQLPWLLLPPQKCSHVRDFYLISNKGDKVWNILDLEYGYFWDVVYYHGRFYAINSLSELKTYHISSGKDNTSTKVEKVSQLPLPGWLLDKAYIVESGGACTRRVAGSENVWVHSF